MEREKKILNPETIKSGDEISETEGKMRGKRERTNVLRSLERGISRRDLRR